MKSIQLLIVATILLSFSCVNKSINKRKENYNFSIKYDFSTADTTKTDKHRYKYSTDTVYVFLEDEFQADSIRIFVNGKQHKQLSVTSDEATGLADIIEIGNIEKIDQLGFAVNNSPVVNFELYDTTMNLIGIEKRNKDIEIVFYKKVPSYY